MSKEFNISPRTLALRTNGIFSPTDRGHLVHELIIINRALKNHANPKIPFAMSEEQKQKHTLRKEDLCGLLGLPSDEKIREKKIQGFDGRLTQMGLPYYRINFK